MRRVRVNNVLSPSDVVCSIIESRKVVMIDSSTLEKNRITFVVRMGRCLPGRFRDPDAFQNVIFQAR